MLNVEEKKLVKEALENYPAGICTSYWGSSEDFIFKRDDEEYPEAPRKISPRILWKYG